MVNSWQENIINAKYHLAVAERLFATYVEYAEKRILIGIINESAKATSHLIRAFLVRERIGGGNPEKNIRIFMERVAPKYMGDLTRENLFKILEVERAQKKSPIEYAKNDSIVLLIDGKYRFLTSKRLREFVESLSEGILKFSADIKR